MCFPVWLRGLLWRGEATRLPDQQGRDRHTAGRLAHTPGLSSDVRGLSLAWALLAGASLGCSPCQSGSGAWAAQPGTMGPRDLRVEVWQWLQTWWSRLLGHGAVCVHGRTPPLGAWVRGGFWVEATGGVRSCSCSLQELSLQGKGGRGSCRGCAAGEGTGGGLRPPRLDEVWGQMAGTRCAVCLQQGVQSQDVWETGQGGGAGGKDVSREDVVRRVVGTVPRGCVGGTWSEMLTLWQ